MWWWFVFLPLERFRSLRGQNETKSDKLRWKKRKSLFKTKERLLKKVFINLTALVHNWFMSLQESSSSRGKFTKNAYIQTSRVWLQYFLYSVKSIANQLKALMEQNVTLESYLCGQYNLYKMAIFRFNWVFFNKHFMILVIFSSSFFLSELNLDE